LVNYRTEINTLLGGVVLKPSEAFWLRLDLAWNESEASFGPFNMQRGEEFAANKPNQSFDFTRTFLNSDISTERIESSLQARYHFRADRWLSGGWRYIDFDDRAPYLFDGTGSVDYYSLSFGLSFG